MFAAILAVVLSADPCPPDAPTGLLPDVGRALQWRGPLEKKRYEHWLRSYPYSVAISQQGVYDFRHEQNYPWSVRSGYSLPLWAAADSRVSSAGAEKTPGDAAEKISPSRPGATSSKQSEN